MCSETLQYKWQHFWISSHPSFGNSSDQTNHNIVNREFRPLEPTLEHTVLFYLRRSSWHSVNSLEKEYLFPPGNYLRSQNNIEWNVQWRNDICLWSCREWQWPIHQLDTVSGPGNSVAICQWLEPSWACCDATLSKLKGNSLGLGSRDLICTTLRHTIFLLNLKYWACSCSCKFQ